jgi:NAD(P)H-flavin reductase
MTDTETLYELELDDKKPLGDKPGQFIELSIFGVGEAPFGVSSPPGDSPRFEIVVRKVGNVTSRLVLMRVGEKVGIRGPFGNGFILQNHICKLSDSTGICESGENQHEILTDLTFNLHFGIWQRLPEIVENRNYHIHV